MPLTVSRLASISLGLIAVACAAGGGTAAAPAASGCPAEAARTVTRLYDWYINAGDAYRDQLQQQKQLFVSAFYADLQAAFRPAPPAKVFLDSDPFNGVQVSSYGYQLQRCRMEGNGRLQAQVAVRAGLGPQRASDRVVNLVLRRSANAWLISDIAYGDDRNSGTEWSLQSLLDRLLDSGGEVLVTPRFRVVVNRRCPEGTVVCDRVSYFGVDRQSGASLRLMGKTLHVTCIDGVTPCRFLGYEFRHGAYVYVVSDDGRLEVSRSGTILLSEQGEWQR